MWPPPWCGPFLAAEAPTMSRSNPDTGVTAARRHRDGRLDLAPD